MGGGAGRGQVPGCSIHSFESNGLGRLQRRTVRRLRRCGAGFCTQSTKGPKAPDGSSRPGQTLDRATDGLCPPPMRLPPGEITRVCASRGLFGASVLWVNSYWGPRGTRAGRGGPLVGEQEDQVNEDGQRCRRALERESDIGSFSRPRRDSAAIPPKQLVLVDPRNHHSRVSLGRSDVRRTIEQRHLGEQVPLQPLRRPAPPLQARAKLPGTRGRSRARHVLPDSFISCRHQRSLSFGLDPRLPGTWRAQEGRRSRFATARTKDRLTKPRSR